MDPKEQILKEIHYRRDKQWNIFSWSSSITLGAIGGFVAISSANNFQVTFFHVAILTLSIFCLCYYSIKWLNQNIEREKNATKKLKHLERDTDLDSLYEDPPKIWGYTDTVSGLSVVAVILFTLAPIIPLSNSSMVFKKDKIVLTLAKKVTEYQIKEIDSASSEFKIYILSK